MEEVETFKSRQKLLLGNVAKLQRDGHRFSGKEAFWGEKK